MFPNQLPILVPNLIQNMIPNTIPNKILNRVLNLIPNLFLNMIQYQIPNLFQIWFQPCFQIYFQTWSKIWFQTSGLQIWFYIWFQIWFQFWFFFLQFDFEPLGIASFAWFEWCERLLPFVAPWLHLREALGDEIGASEAQTRGSWTRTQLRCALQTSPAAFFFLRHHKFGDGIVILSSEGRMDAQCRCIPSKLFFCFVFFPLKKKGSLTPFFGEGG